MQDSCSREASSFIPEAKRRLALPRIEFSRTRLRLTAKQISANSVAMVNGVAAAQDFKKTDKDTLLEVMMQVGSNIRYRWHD